MRVQEANDTGFQRVLGTDYDETGGRDQFFDQLRSVTQVILGCADVGAYGVPNQRCGVVPQLGCQQSFYRRTNAIDNRMQITRLFFRRLLQDLQRRTDSAALRVSENHDQPRAKPFGRKFDAADLRRGNYISGNSDYKQIAQTLIKDELCRHSRIGASKNDCKRLLARRQVAVTLAGNGVAGLNMRHEPKISFLQAFERLLRWDHRHCFLSFVRLMRGRTTEPATCANCGLSKCTDPCFASAVRGLVRVNTFV